MSENTNFAFVLNLFDFDCELPFNITDNCYLQKANLRQTQEIKNYFKTTGLLSNVLHYDLNPYELKVVNEPDNSGFRFESVEEQYWKYYIVNFEGDISKIDDLSRAISLAEIEIELGLKFMYHKEPEYLVVYQNITHVFNYFQEVKSNLHVRELINEEHLNEIGYIYKSFQKFDKIKYPDITRAIARLHELKSLPRNSEFKILGLFSIIELLITHNSSGTENSISNQVVNKIALLSRRFDREISNSQFFGDMKESNIWKKLYDYRSKIAHGGEVDFTSDLCGLKDSFNAMKFLQTVVKALLRKSLIEPELYTYLKKC